MLASSFTFAFPGVLQQPFVDPDTWGYRFRIVTMLGFNLPMVRPHGDVVCCLCAAFVLPCVLPRVLVAPHLPRVLVVLPCVCVAV